MCKRRFQRGRVTNYSAEPLEPRRLLATGAAALGDIIPPADALVSQAVAVDPWSYFFARDAAGTTARLWRTDGTPANTDPTDVAFEVTAGGIDPKPLLAFQDKLLFIADAGAAGRELWVSDGTG